MASSFKLRHFSNPSILRNINRTLLVAFLDPHRAFLAQRGFDLVNSDEFDYDALVAILMSPDEDTPDTLLDALFFVDEMSLPDCHEDLLTEAYAEDIDLPESDGITTADLAVRLWLTDSNILERMHAERFLVKPKSFQYFLSTFTRLPDLHHPAEAVLQALQEELNDWFETKKRGRGTRVFPFAREDGFWFLVRHGEPYKREGTLENGESSSVYYRPEKFDVLMYNPQIGELAIHAGTKGEKQAYCRSFGKHLFGSDAFFDIESVEGKFTLEPIIADWRNCVACEDVEGLDEVRLTELQFRHNAMQYHVEVHKADDVFAAMDDIERAVPAGATLLRASFKVKFTGALRPRTVVIRPPNVTIFDRESDSDLLNRWMTERGFIRLEASEDDAEPDAVLAVS
ncbi:MAG: hypothetical protein WD534_12745 [Phycisphaeraceae bacterium]